MLGLLLAGGMIDLSKYAQKFIQNAFGDFPKFVPIIIFVFLIMLVTCSNMNNTAVKIYCFNILLEHLRYYNSSM